MYDPVTTPPARRLRYPFARLALQAPSWVLIDEALDTLDAGTWSRVRQLLERELQHSALIHIGREPLGDDSIYTRTLYLVTDPDQRRLHRGTQQDQPKAGELARAPG